MNIQRQTKSLIAVGCSHADHICPRARAAVLEFIKRHKPAYRIHLGDFCDTSAFRKGARDAGDEPCDSVKADLDSGLTFLAEMRATHVLCGNHEDRLWKLAESTNELVAYAAGMAVAAVTDHCKKLGAELIEYGGAFQALKIGGTTFSHGYLYNENATRDHAEAHGDIVHAHTHRASFAVGRCVGSPRGFCTGTLARKREFSYAKGRRATLSWSQAFVWGEVRSYKSGDVSHLNLCLGPREESPAEGWLLP